MFFVAGLLFGATFAMVRSTGAGWHGVFGNLTAPWLVLPIVSGTLASRRFALAALMGAAWALVSLVGFWASASVVWPMDNRDTSAGTVVILVAVPVGAGVVAGASTFLKPHENFLLIGWLLAIEPFAWVVWYLVEGAPFPWLSGLVFVGELAAGVIVIDGSSNWAAKIGNPMSSGYKRFFS